MSVLTTYTVPPEHVVQIFLSAMIRESRLEDLGIECPVIHGHPIFHEGINSTGPDKKWPVIGVEWVSDDFEDYVGYNYRSFRPSDKFRKFLSDYKDIPQKHRHTTDAVLDDLAMAKTLESFDRNVKSTVVIAGFASGATGRNTMQKLYRMVSAMVAPLAYDIVHAYPSVTVMPQKNHEINIQSDQFAQPLFGFEIPIVISQVARTIRKKPDSLFPDTVRFDIHVEESRTVFQTSGLFDF